MQRYGNYIQTEPSSAQFHQLWNKLSHVFHLWKDFTVQAEFWCVSQLLLLRSWGLELTPAGRRGLAIQMHWHVHAQAAAAAAQKRLWPHMLSFSSLKYEMKYVDFTANFQLSSTSGCFHIFIQGENAALNRTYPTSGFASKSDPYEDDIVPPSVSSSCWIIRYMLRLGWVHLAAAALVSSVEATFIALIYMWICEGEIVCHLLELPYAELQRQTGEQVLRCGHKAPVRAEKENLPLERVSPSARSL